MEIKRCRWGRGSRAPGWARCGPLRGAVAAVLLGGFAAVGCGGEPIVVEGEEGAIAGKVPTWEEYRASARQISESGLVTYIIEGDIALDEATLAKVYKARYTDQIDKSTVLTSGGVDVVWTAAQKVDITYCVSNAWGSQKAQALADMQEATAQWMSAANVVFKYVPSQDAACSDTNTGVRINVVPHGGGGLGCAPNSCRYLKMNYAANFSNYSWLGAWTHEVGHTLGLWHEHLRAECGVNEGVTIRALTTYDNRSSLHYDTVCGSPSTGQMTNLDKQGLASLYGASTATSLKVTPASWIGSSMPGVVN